MKFESLLEDAITFLLKNRADVNQTDNLDNTALYYAIKRENTADIKLLLEYGQT